MKDLGFGKFLNFLFGFFFNNPETPSMKRLCGLMCVCFLCITLCKSLFSPITNDCPRYLIESISLLAFGCLGLTSVEKVFNKKNKKNED